ncbi:hypothetical protein [Streptomyces platensis]
MVLVVLVCEVLVFQDSAGGCQQERPDNIELTRRSVVWHPT